MFTQNQSKIKPETTCIYIPGRKTVESDHEISVKQGSQKLVLLQNCDTLKSTDGVTKVKVHSFSCYKQFFIAMWKF
jgi:hypothetical protein